MSTTTTAPAPKVTGVSIRFGYVYAEVNGEKVEAGVDRTFGIKRPTGARYRCNCGNHYDLPRDIARHLTDGACDAL